MTVIGVFGTDRERAVPATEGGEPRLAPELAAGVDILVVDDEPTLREGCAGMLRAYGYGVTSAGRGDEALALVRQRRFDIILLDLYVRPVGGMEIMRAALEVHPETIVIVMTGRPTLSSSMNALRAGAWDYLPKPFSSAHLDILLGRAVHALFSPRGTRAAPQLRDADAPHEGAMLLGGSAVIRNVIELARRVARTDAPVMLSGESGTGKSMLARFIHQQSRRAGGVFMPVHCAALCDAQLLGGGANTSAEAVDGAGLLAAARGGTLFLQGLASLAPPAQAKLARALQDGGTRSARREGADAGLDVRLVSALEQEPDEAVRAGALRPDLLQRLCVVPIRIPALRERPEDIPLLAQRFLALHWEEQRGTRLPAPTLGAESLDRLRSFGWPGNVRELRQVMQRLAAVAEPGAEIGHEDIPIAEDETVRMPVCPGLSADIVDDEYAAAKEKVLVLFEREYLPRLLQRAGWNIARAARLASVDRTTLYRLMEKHGLRPEAPA